jgi:hypothetical protein
MYYVHMGSPCAYRAHELTKFMKQSKKITYIVSMLLHMCIKFQVKTHYSLSITKREILDMFLLLFCYYEFELEFLYADEVE